jgi:hypothetical protein
MEWAKTLMMNSCDSLLVERIDKKFEDLRQDKQVNKVVSLTSNLHLMRCSP